MTIKDLLALTDNVIDHLNHNNLMGVPDFVFERLFDIVMIQDVKKAVQTTWNCVNDFLSTLKSKETHQSARTRVPFSKGIIFLQRFYLLFLIGGFTLPVRTEVSFPCSRSSSPCSRSMAQNESINVPYRMGLFDIKDAQSRNRELSSMAENFTDHIQRSWRDSSVRQSICGKRKILRSSQSTQI